MNAEEFFEIHSIDEINKRTKISPISLRYIKNKEFNKLIRVKFIGFIRIIEKEYNVDLSELIEEYENFYNKDKIKTEKTEKTEKKEVKNEEKPQKESKNYFFTILIIMLFIISAVLYFGFLNKKDKKEDYSSINSSITDNKDNDKNLLIKSDNKIIIPKEQNLSNNIIEKNETKPIVKDYNITIIPNEKVWFRAFNIDTNKTKEFLTSHTKTLEGNYYIKFGHGNLTISYNNQIISPKTKKIVRILLKNGKYKFLNKPNRYEK